MLEDVGNNPAIGGCDSLGLILASFESLNPEMWIFSFFWQLNASFIRSSREKFRLL